jgi:ABC-type transport system involved in cytochrome bd biosynthesis fused ATPase/permease subunit
MRTAGQLAVPSRNTNPFATCWTWPGALPFRFPGGQTAEQLVARLAAQQWRGAIIGPHGCGKSTLLATLAPYLAQADRPVRVVDGFDQLTTLERWRLRRRCQKIGHGLVVTAHRAAALPTLIVLAPSAKLVQDLVAELTAARPTPVTPADVDASYARRGHNVREILFDLYDCHEQLRTAGPAHT